MGINLIAALWGFAEATLFMFVPDVFLSAVGLLNFRSGLKACLWALAGALIGGVIMYEWGARDPAGVSAVLDRIPAISPEMIARVHRSLTDRGSLAILVGPLYGIPYKIFASQAPATGIGLGLFLLVSVPARLVRFLIVTAGARWIADRLMKEQSPSRKLTILLVCWAVFYAFYFTIMPG